MRVTRNPVVRARVLPCLAAALAATCVLQLTLLPFGRETRVAASWANLATSLEEAKSLSSVILAGHVERVVLQSDITVLATGEPAGVDRVPVEVVRLAVDRVYKGDVPSAIGLFHTALASPGGTAVPLGPEDEAPAKRATIAAPGETESRRVLLDGDPAYEPGEHYLLFLRPGPTVEGTATLAVIGPEGRYRLDWPGAYRDDSQLHALTARGVAPQLDGRPVGEIVTRIAERPPRDVNRNNRGRASTRTIIGGVVGAAAIGYLIGHGDRRATPDPNADPSTPARTSSGPARTTAVTGGGAPRDLRPGSADPQSAPSLRTRDVGTVALSWRPPAGGDAARYGAVVFLESATGSEPIFTAVVDRTVARVPSNRLPPGLYAWFVRSIDAAGNDGPPATTVYFRVMVEPSRAATPSPLR